MDQIPKRKIIESTNSTYDQQLELNIDMNTGTCGNHRKRRKKKEVWKTALTIKLLLHAFGQHMELLTITCFKNNPITKVDRIRHSYKLITTF